MKIILILLLTALTSLSACTMEKSEEKMDEIKDYDKKNMQTATFAGGCFWCMEAAFEDYPGIFEVVSGYSGGHVKNPTYEKVSAGETGHRETIQIVFDPLLISYEELLDLFWKQIDPTDNGGQFVDRGFQYTSAIFYHDENQKKLAEKSKKELDKSGKLDKPVVTEIIPFESFYKAEEYHQDYSKKRTVRYNIYKKASGREKTLDEIWDDSTNSEK